MQSNDYTFKGGDQTNDVKRWVEDETDLTHDSPFHTIGRGATQAASGNHKHTADEISGLPAGISPSDAVPKLESGAGSPGVGTKFSRDDHIHPAASGGLALGNTIPPADSGTGGVGSSTFAAKADHYHPAHNSAYADNANYANSAGNADTVDGQHASAFAAAGHGHDYASSSHGHNPSASGITPQLHGPYTVNAGAELTIGPIAKASNEYVFYSLFHSSAYIFLSMPSQNANDFTIKIRNSTASTNHSGIYVMTLRVRAA